MSSSQRISERFNMFYDEIDAQLNRSCNRDSIFSQFSIQSDDAKLLKRMEKGEFSSNVVDDLITAAKEFDDELKNFIDKNKLRQRIARQKKKPLKPKSCLPPIWDDDKLNQYIDDILEKSFRKENEVSDEEEKKEEVVVDVPIKEKVSRENLVEPIKVKAILKSQKSKQPKRTVSTNVKFQIHEPKPPTKKIPKKSKVDDSSCKISKETLFPFRSESLLNEKGSVNVNLAPSSESPVNKKLTRPLSASKLKYSPITLTSTAGQSTTKPDNDVDKVCDSYLATSSSGKQMTSRVLPALSIKGSCSIQKIYQLEISPSRDVRSHSNDLRLNTKFSEFIYEQPKSEIVVNEPEEVSQEIPKSLEDENNFFDARDVQKLLSGCGVKVRDGKLHVIVEKSRKRGKSKTRKSFKSSALRRSVDETRSEVVDNEKKKDEAVQSKAEMEVQINEEDSSLSSSITDDRKIREILKINREADRDQRRRHREKSSSESYPTSSPNQTTKQQPPINEIERSVSENFQKFYKLIEDSFEPKLEAEPRKEIVEDGKEIDDGMNEMREVIKRSEENMKRANKLLQKHQMVKESRALKGTPSTNETPSKVVRASRKILFEKNENLKSSDQHIQTASDELPEANENFETLTSDPFVTSQRNKTADSSVQTAEDKIVQTDGNLTWKSQQYFGSVYEAYSNFDHVNFNQTPKRIEHNPLSSFCNCVGCQEKSTQRLRSPFKSINASPKLSVPYNPIYSEDDEVMKAAEKFLRSVEKQKNRKIEITSNEFSSSSDFSPQKVNSKEFSSSISTPSSSLLENMMCNVKETNHETARPQRNFDDKLSEAAKEVEEQLEPLADESHPTRSSSNSSEVESTDWMQNQDFFDRYLSDGEVMSQGEIQLGLRADYVADDDF